MSRAAVFLVVLAFAAAVQAAKKLPDYIQVCKRSDPEFDACVVRSIESLRGRLGRGIPQLQLPGYEPLVIPALHVERTNDALDISAQLENVKLAGASKFVLNGLKTSLADHGLQVNVTLPELQFSTNFDVTGRILVVPITGKGALDGTLQNVKCELRAKGEVTERKGKKYLQIASMRSDIRVGDAKLNFKSAGDKASPLDTPATAFIRENRGQVLQLVKPLVEDTVNEFIMTVMNRVFQVVPYDTILPA